MKRSDDALELALRVRDQRFHARSQAILGLVYYQRGNHAKALFHLERADVDLEVLNAAIRSCLALGKLRAAEEHVLKASAFSAQSTEFLHVARLVQRLVERRNTLLEELKPAQDQADAWMNLLNHFVMAEHAHAEGKPAEQVERSLIHVFGAEVEYGPAYGLRGMLALEKGRLAKALADAERCLALSPGCTLGLEVRGRVRLERGAEGALTDLEEAVRLSERKEAGLLHWLAAAQEQAGLHAEALATQREAARLRPNDALIQEQLSTLEGTSRSR